MKKIIFSIFLILISISIYIIIIDYPKKLISRIIFSHDLSLLTNNVFKNINNQVEFDMMEKNNKKKSLIIINNFIYDFIKPVYNTELNDFRNLDAGVSWKLLDGSIWCDGVADIFIKLVENLNTRATVAFLYKNDGISPHTLNLIDLDNSINNFEDISKIKQMYLFDAQHNYFPINKKNKFVDLNYMLKNKNEFSGFLALDSDNIKLNLLQNDPFIITINRIYNEYSILNKLSLFVVKILPNNLLKNIYKFGIFINPDLKNDYKKFLYARLEHILLNYEIALLKYSEIDNHNDYYEDAIFWQHRLKSSKSVLKKKYEYILTSNYFDILHNRYRHF